MRQVCRIGSSRDSLWKAFNERRGERVAGRGGGGGVRKGGHVTNVASFTNVSHTGGAVSRGEAVCGLCSIMLCTHLNILL